METFLPSVGGPWSAEDVEADLAVYDSFYRGDGWYADGDERSFDHYGGWALHLYPVLWARMAARGRILTGQLFPGLDVGAVARPVPVR